MTFYRSYKELMAKCNALGRGDARSLKKLEKAKEKIQSLKVSRLNLRYLDYDMVRMSKRIFAFVRQGSKNLSQLLKQKRMML